MTVGGLVRWETTIANQVRVEPTKHRCRWWTRDHNLWLDPEEPIGSSGPNRAERRQVSRPSKA